jgi:hypothetical protein
VTASEFLRRLVSMLDTAAVPYMLAGSFASAYHGTPRTTQDVDLVIDPGRETLDAFVSQALEAGYYVDRDHAHEALRQRRQFNVLDPRSGWKADLVVLKDRAFSREEFGRRKSATMFGADVFVASAEDTILSKLEWAARSGSERQLADVAGIVRLKGAILDRAYVERWARELGVLDLWQRLTATEPSPP